MHGLEAVLAGCGHMADEVEWPLERLTNQQNPSVPSVSSVRDLPIPILRFTAAPELVANRVLRFPSVSSVRLLIPPSRSTRKSAIYPAAVDPEQPRRLGDVAA
jgi:hypothetical protein